MRELLRPMLPMIVVLAIPIVPFLLFGEQVEAWLRSLARASAAGRVRRRRP